MTLNNVIDQVYNLAVGGFINSEKFTKTRFRDQVKAMFRDPEQKRYIFEIALPDGKWFMMIDRYKSEYGYWIPETREQEQKIIDLLFSR